MYKMLSCLGLVLVSCLVLGCSGQTATDNKKGDEVQELDLDFKGKKSFDPNAESQDQTESADKTK